jgi:hypothetical protein
MPYLDMTQDMPFSILRQGHPEDRSDGQVNGGRFEDGPFGDRKAFDENEALSIHDILSDRG